MQRQDAVRHLARGRVPWRPVDLQVRGYFLWVLALRLFISLFPPRHLLRSAILSSSSRPFLSPLPQALHDRFTAIDVDGSDTLTLSEFMGFWEGLRGALHSDAVYARLLEDCIADFNISVCAVWGRGSLRIDRSESCERVGAPALGTRVILHRRDMSCFCGSNPPPQPLPL